MMWLIWRNVRVLTIVGVALRTGTLLSPKVPATPYCISQVLSLSSGVQVEGAHTECCVARVQHIRTFRQRTMHPLVCEPMGAEHLTRSKTAVAIPAQSPSPEKTPRHRLRLHKRVKALLNAQTHLLLHLSEDAPLVPVASAPVEPHEGLLHLRDREGVLSAGERAVLEPTMVVDQRREDCR